MDTAAVCAAGPRNARARTAPRPHAQRGRGGTEVRRRRSGSAGRTSIWRPERSGRGSRSSGPSGSTAATLRMPVERSGTARRAGRTARAPARNRLQAELQEAFPSLLQASLPERLHGPRGQVPEAYGRRRLLRQRKGKSRLTLQCPPALLALLRAHKRLQAAERLKAGDRWTDYDLVFTTKLGGPIERTEDWKQWKSILKQARRTGCQGS